MDNVIINPMKYFDFKREPKWLNDEFVRKMILDIDNAKVIQDEFIMNNEGRAITHKCELKQKMPKKYALKEN